MSEAVSATRHHLWLLNMRVTIRVSYEDGTDRISVLEHQAPHGNSPPLHIHRNEDEVFHVVEGDLRFLVSGNELRAGAGQTLIAPNSRYRCARPGYSVCRACNRRSALRHLIGGFPQTDLRIGLEAAQ